MKLEGEGGNLLNPWKLVYLSRVVVTQAFMEIKTHQAVQWKLMLLKQLTCKSKRNKRRRNKTCHNVI